jgi:hypothetical protein
MAFEVTGLEFALQVSANASAGIPQFAAVKLDASGNVGDCILAATSTDPTVGFNQDMGGAITTLAGAPPVCTSGQSIRVRFNGITKANASAAISLGDLLMVTTSGQVATATAPAATSIHIVGQAMEAATEAGDIITVLLFPLGSSIVNA